jgi:membrane protein required for colicin V production
MNALDIVLLGLVVISGLLSLRLGLVREVFALGALLIGIFGAILLARAFAPVLPMLFGSAAVTQIIFFLICFLVLHVFVSLIGAVISRFLRAAKMGAVDHLLGFLFGLARGTVLAILLIVGLTFVLPAKHSLFAGSRGCSWADTPVRIFAELLPEKAGDFLRARYGGLRGSAAPAPTGAPIGRGESARASGWDEALPL